MTDPALADPALTLGTAGHIDHGKTSLVRALTGVDTDRLPEERERGISIELGFARMDLPSGRWLSVVDVPGHERFVRTMVAGATGIDLFLLVVAADDGVMPQTREHVAVLEQLEVPGGVVALTKADLVGAEERALAQAEVEELLALGPYAATPVVSVSAARGTGLDELRAQLDTAARATPGRARLGGPPRLHVDRSFTLQGIGTVVTGTLWSGSVARGAEVRIEPGGARARVRGVEVHAEPRPRAEAGQRVALNLAGVERSDVQRGDVVVGGDAAPAAGYLLDVEVRLLAGARPLERGARVHVHHGTRETAARVSPVEGERLEPGEAGLAQLRLERPLMAAAGDRFVLRALAPPDTIGGGRVLDPRPRKHGPGEAHVARLGALRSGDPLEVLRLEIEAARSGLEAADRSEELGRLAGTGEAVFVGGRRRRWFTPGLLEEARAALMVAAGEDPRPRSAAALAHSAGLDAGGAAAVLEALAAEGRLERRGGGYVRAGAQARPPGPLEQALLQALEGDGVQPGAIVALAARTGVAPAQAREALDRLAARGDVTRVKPGIYYHPDAVERARAEAVSLCEREGTVTIARLRDRLATGRKHAQALLEHLDAIRVTRRVGDEHVLRRPG
jgi:selenocysteine-specific elongation factor